MDEMSPFTQPFTCRQANRLWNTISSYELLHVPEYKANIHTNFRCEWVLTFVIDYAWISKLLHDAAFTWRPSLLKSELFRDFFSGHLAIWTVLVLEKVLFYCFWVPDGHQHGVSIQISMNMGKKLLHISCMRKIAVTWILARVFA